MATGGDPGKGKSPVSVPQTWPKTREEFVREWFWRGTNGNDLIKELNTSRPSRGNDYIRREKARPTVYGIVLNKGLGDEVDHEWKLCKVGFTHVNTDPGEGNRMEQVIADIKRKYDSKGKGRKAKPDVLFVLAIGAVDTTPFSDTEKRIRNAVGWPLDKKVAKELGLPCSTEWVLTTQKFIDVIKDKIKKLKGNADPIDLFKDCKFNPPKQPSWVKLDPGSTPPTVTSLTVKD